MQITVVSNNKGKMCKTYNKDLTKDGSSQLYEGNYKVIKLSSLEQIGIVKQKLKSNQAIILGTPVEGSGEGKIYSRSNLKSDGITRTKDMFENKSGIIMFDFDLRDYTDITLEEYRNMLIKCDPQLENTEMFLTYGSSAGITNGKDETGYGSVHAYCRINKEMYIKSYSEALFNNGLNEGFGEIKVNEKVFRGYINGIVDLALLKGDPSRIIYEALPILHKKLKRVVRDDLYYPGGVINGGLVRKTNINTTYQSKVNDMIHNLKKTYKSTSKDHKDIKRRNIERTNQIYGNEKLILNDGTTIKAREILVGNYVDVSMRDPFEPEKGMNKAKVFESLDLTKRPAMHSFVHGGQMYYFHCDLKSIPFIVENMDEEDVFTIIKRDFKGYMLDKAINILVDTMDKTKGAIKKYLKESDYSTVKDINVTDDGFNDEEKVDSEQERAWKQLSDNTFYVTEGKHPLYVEIDEDGTIHLQTPMKLRETYKEFNTKDSDFITDWIEGGYRKKIRGVRFDPSKDPKDIMDNGYYNLWKGFACESIEGDVQPFIEFTRDIVVGGADSKSLDNIDMLEFMLDYLAHIVQFPEKKEGMACVLKGKKGVGKDTWIGAFASLFDRSHYITVNNMDSITGRFNIHLQNSVVCNIGEAFFSGNHAAEGALKTLITENEMHYEQKGIDAFSGDNFSRVFMSTNLDWVVPAKGDDERRYIVLEMSDKYRGNLEYMDKFRIWLNNGGREALLHFLMEREITHKMYKAPETTALVEQKEQGLNKLEEWLYNCSMSNKMLGDSWGNKFFDTEVHPHAMFEAYSIHSKDKYAGNVASFSRRVNEMADPKLVRRHDGRMKLFKKGRFIKAFKDKTGILIKKDDLGSL